MQQHPKSRQKTTSLIFKTPFPMQKRKAIRTLTPIIEDLAERTGTEPPIPVLFRYNPETLVDLILNCTEAEILAVLTDPKHPQTLTVDEARDYARRLKQAVDIQVKRRTRGGLSYPYAVKVLDTTLGLTTDEKAEIKCDDKKMTAPFWKLEHVFLTLLHETSECTDPTDAGAFLGNMDPEPAEVMVSDEAGEVSQRTIRKARVSVPFYEIARRYCGGRKPGAKDKDSVFHILNKYKDLVFAWTVRKEMPDGRVFLGTMSDKRVDVRFWSLTDKETADQIEGGNQEARAQNQNVVLTFNPAFRSFLSKTYGYVLTPKDLDTRLEKAAGSTRKVSDPHWRFFHFLNRQRGRGRKEAETVQTEINREKLLTLLNLKTYLETRNAHKVDPILKDIFETMKRLGILKKAAKRAGKMGDTVFTFEVCTRPAWNETPAGLEPINQAGRTLFDE